MSDFHFSSFALSKKAAAKTCEIMTFDPSSLWCIDQLFGHEKIVGPPHILTQGFRAGKTEKENSLIKTPLLKSKLVKVKHRAKIYLHYSETWLVMKHIRGLF